MGPVEKLLMQAMAEEEQARLRRYAAAWDAYYGRYQDPLVVKQGDPNDNVVINYTGVIVDKGVSFLFGEDMQFKLEDGGERLEKTADELWLDRCLSYNRKMTMLVKAALNGAVCGHTFLRLRAPENGSPFPRVIVWDPAMVSVTWDPDDIDRVTEFRATWAAIDPVRRKPVNRRQVISDQGGSWLIVDQQSEPDSKVWQTLGESVWDYPFPPVVHCQNLPAPNEFYGLSDLEDAVIRLNRAINLLASNTNRILRFYASPKTWAKGVTAKEINAEIGGVICLPNPDSELHNLEMQSDLQSSIQFYDKLREAFHEISRVPEVATGKLENLGNLSGLALAILYQPLLEKTVTKRMLYGEMLVDLVKRLMVLGGRREPENVVPVWPEMLPGNPKEEAETYLLHQQLGASKETLLEKLGYDPEREAERRANEAQAAADAAMRRWNDGGDEEEQAAAGYGRRGGADAGNGGGDGEVEEER